MCSLRPFSDAGCAYLPLTFLGAPVRIRETGPWSLGAKTVTEEDLGAALRDRTACARPSRFGIITGMMGPGYCVAPDEKKSQQKKYIGFFCQKKPVHMFFFVRCCSRLYSITPQPNYERHTSIPQYPKPKSHGTISTGVPCVCPSHPALAPYRALEVITYISFIHPIKKQLRRSSAQAFCARERLTK